MTSNEIIQNLLDLALEKFSIRAAAIDLDGSIVSQLNLDSLSMADIIIEIEEIFEFEFEEDDLGRITTLNGLAAIIEKHLADK